MNSAATHHFAPQEVMSFVDGELTAAESQAAAAHIADCPECSVIADEFRATSQRLAQWQANEAPARLADAVQRSATHAAERNSGRQPAPFTFAKLRRPKVWMYASGGALACTLLVLALPFVLPRHLDRTSAFIAGEGNGRLQSGAGVAGAGLENRQPIQAAIAGAEMDRPSPAPPVSASQPAPMIERSVTMVIVVRNIAASRTALDSMLARHHGYAAQITVYTPERDASSIEASLRIPVPELTAALADLRALGRVSNESQSGEDVTQQHADLEQRLKTARDTEERFRTILQQRTGKVSDVLEVEEAIARVRGEIESMEAEQKNLEHRVEYATISLTLSETPKANFSTEDAASGSRMRNALATGYRNTVGTVAGIVVFLIEFGPSILIWMAIVVLPAFLLWRRYRSIRARL